MGRKRGPKVVLWIVAALLVAVGVLGVSLALSTSSIMGKMDQIQEASERLDTEMGDFDFTAVASRIEEISSLWGDVADETSEWQWQVARSIPVLGEDVTSLQSAASIADRLSNEAVAPVTAQLKVLSEGFDTDVFSIIDNKISQLGDLIAVFSEARAVVSECRTEADALPQAHLTQVNEVVKTLKEEVDSIDDVLGIFDTLAEATTTDSMGDATAA